MVWNHQYWYPQVTKGKQRYQKVCSLRHQKVCNRRYQKVPSGIKRYPRVPLETHMPKSCVHNTQSCARKTAEDFGAEHKPAFNSEAAQPKLTKLGININLPKVYLTIPQNPTSASNRLQWRPFCAPSQALWKWPYWGCMEAEAGFVSVV